MNYFRRRAASTFAFSSVCFFFYVQDFTICQVKHGEDEDSETPLLAGSRAGSVQGMYLLPPPSSSTSAGQQAKPPKWKFLRNSTIYTT